MSPQCATETLPHGVHPTEKESINSACKIPTRRKPIAILTEITNTHNERQTQEQELSQLIPNAVTQ